MQIYSQDKKLDSLNAILSTQKNDTNKVNTLTEICDVYYKKNDGYSLLAYAKIALDISKQISFKRGIGTAYLNHSKAYYMLNDINLPVRYASLALAVFEEINWKEGLLYANLTLATVVQYTDDWPDAVKHAYIALELHQQAGNLRGEARCLELVGMIYYFHDDYDKAFTAFNDALTIYKKSGADYGAEGPYIFLANILRVRGLYKKALQYDSLGLRLAKGNGNQDMIGTAYLGIGDVLTDTVRKAPFKELRTDEINSLQTAVKLYRDALGNFKNVFDSGAIGDTYQRLASVHIRLNRIAKAQSYADSALIVAKRLQYKDNLRASYLVQGRIDSARGEFKLALEAYKQYILYRDSLVNAEYLQKSTRAQMEYEFDKKEAAKKAEQERKDAETKRIKNRQYFIITVLGIVVLAVLTIAFIEFRNNKQKQKANVLLQQQKQKVESTLSELKATQSQLIQSEKMASLGELTAGIAHEIQNPLNFVNNFSDVNQELLAELNEEIEKGNYDDAKAIAKDVIDNEEKINHHGKRADSIVRGMLQHSRTSSGHKELTDINKLADEFFRLSYHGFHAKDKSFKAEIITEFGDTVGKINVVPQDIGRAFLNLINNAFYAVNERRKVEGVGYEPRVTVSTKKIRDKILISVRDNGGGISQKIIDKIFQPFFTTKPTGQGTGLGLSLAYDIVKAHGGEINVETKERDCTEFIVTLPGNDGSSDK